MAFAAFALGGCNAGGGGSYSATFSLPVEITQEVTTVGGSTDVFVTMLSYDKEGLVSREVTTKNEFNHRELKDYVRELNDDGDLIQTCTRTTVDDDGFSKTHKLVSTYGTYYGGSWLETKFEVFTISSEPERLESREVEYSSGRHTSYEAWTLEGGMVTRDEYNYSDVEFKPIQTYREVRSKDGTDTTTIVGIKSIDWGNNQYNPTEYELYNNISLPWDGRSGELIEEGINFESKVGEHSWTIKKYGAPFDANGKGTLISTTKVTMVFQDITIEA